MQVDKCVQVGNVTLMFNKQSGVADGLVYHHYMFVLGVIDKGVFVKRAYTVSQIATLIGANLLDVTLYDYQCCAGHDKKVIDWYTYLVANINASYKADAK